MEYLDEEVLKFRKSVKKEKYNSLETGMYIKDELIHFKEAVLFDGRMRIMLPDTFVDMPSSIVKVKYPSEQRPQIIKTSLDTTVNFTFSLFSQEFEEKHIKSAIEQFREIIRKVNPAFLFYDLIIEEEKKLGWFDFKSYGLDEQIYNIMYVTPVEGKMLHGIFNCMYRDVMEWKTAVRQIMMSIVDCTKEKGEK